MRDPLRAILDEELGDLTALPMEEIRTRRASCREVETGLSYLRRLVQGRLDVVAAEQARRDAGGSAEDDLDELIARLPELLAASTRSPGLGRLPSDLSTGDVDEDLAAELEAIAADVDLTDPSGIESAELATIVAGLESFERQVSDLRRQLFDRIDALEGELTRRYRSGEATVDSLLHE